MPTILSDRRIIDHGVAAGIPAFVVEQCDALHESLVTFLEAAIRVGVQVAAGNDGGAPLVAIGDMVDELELYVRHGMTPQSALASATTVTAALFGLPDVGLVETGHTADLLVVDGDPLASIGALRDPVQVFRAGVLVKPEGRAGALRVLAKPLELALIQGQTQARPIRQLEDAALGQDGLLEQLRDALGRRPVLD